MSFDVKYDEKGNVISPAPIAEEQPTSAYYAQPEVPEEPEAQQEIEESTQEVEQPAQKPNSAQESFARLRQKAEAAERRAAELERQLAAQQQEPEEDLSISMNDDDLAEGRHLTKVDKKIRKLEAKLSQYEQYNNQLAIENRIKAQYPDFNDVVSVENVQRLQDEYPEILATLRSSQDMYAQGVSAYTMIKKLGIVPDDGMASLNKIKSNTAKPRTAASISTQRGETPLAKANPFAEGLTPELKAALLKEMNDAMRNKY